MGVRGFKRLLEERGVTPPPFEGCCSPKLWREMVFAEGKDHTDAWLSFVRTIPPGSTFLVDGNGLAFWLHRIAHARHVRRSTETLGQTYCPKVGELSQEDISKMLPSMIPLEFLKEATKEFVSTLRQCKIELVCYWDGPEQRFKTGTLEKRQQRRSEEWEALKQFCFHGTLPVKKNDRTCGLHDLFPFSGLFLKTVKHALRVSLVEMVQCTEEADVELAQKATGDPTVFVLGQDSDFCFFRGIQYVPFDGVYSSQAKTQVGIKALCLTREGLSSHLGLNDSQMVELAILLGNDYVDAQALKLSYIDSVRPASAAVAFIASQSTSFQVETTCEVGSVPLDFIRCLYDLADLDRFPFEDYDETESHDESASSEETTASSRPFFPDNFAVTTRRENSIRAAVVHSLHTYVEKMGSIEHDAEFSLQQSHLDAYESSTSPSGMKNLDQSSARPRWEDVCASFIIESCVSRILGAPSNMLLAKGTPPESLMNHLCFHATLAQTLEPSTSSQLTEFGDADTLEAGDTPVVQAKKKEIGSVEREELPIDKHQDVILQNISDHRVSIIHGETGCGKSSRVPVMILDAPSPEPSLPDVKVFISQPRRIAAASLVDRVRSCEPKHGNKFALRMGHGVREHESRDTKAWFVTAGYLTRLLANHPERFDKCTHIVIDEVHERSIETDLLCLLCRRLLSTNTKIRLVLMSATLATGLYKDYFEVANDPIFVGVKRFPITEFFLEDLKQFNLPKKETQTVGALVKECDYKRCKAAPPATLINKSASLAARLAAIVGKPGNSVLVFVPGMNEITAVTESIDDIHTPGVRFVCYPIHSEIPFDEQMGVFDPPEEDEVKVIVATNAAESSVTLPAVDHVICLGLCRQIIYNESSHRQMLSAAWISRASAIQRAGRTGRLRPGSVYRLYTRSAFRSMDEFEVGEMCRIPLDSVILMLKEMLHEEAKPILLESIEPPPMSTIDKSFESLHRSNFLTGPDDSAAITTLGKFVSALGLDLALGSFIGLGIQFGVAAESVEMAATMSMSRSPFRWTHALYQEAKEYNSICSKSFVAKCHFDASAYSEPIGLMNALWDFRMAENKKHFCFHYGLVERVMYQLNTTTRSLRERVANFLGISDSYLQVSTPPACMPHTKLSILRTLMVWVFSENVIKCPPSTLAPNASGGVQVSLPRRGGMPKDMEGLFDQVLSKDRHPYKIVDSKTIQQIGEFQFKWFDFFEFLGVFEKRLVSYMIETKIKLCCCYSGGDVLIYHLDDDQESEQLVAKVVQASSADPEIVFLPADSDPAITRRGISERKCGLWAVGTPAASRLPPSSKEVERIFCRRIKLDGIGPEIFNKSEYAVASTMLWNFHTRKKRSKKQQTMFKDVYQRFDVTLTGECRKVVQSDFQDLFGTKFFRYTTNKSSSSLSVELLPSKSQVFEYLGKGRNLLAMNSAPETSSWHRPIINDIPEGARLLAVLASGQRNGGHRVRFAPLDAEDSDTTVDIFLKKDETDLNKRWQTLGNGFTYVRPDTVPTAAYAPHPLLACCSNALEMKGGATKMEGVTLLPSNPLFALLSFLTFGLDPTKRLGHTLNEADVEELVNRSMIWLIDHGDGGSGNGAKGNDTSEVKRRIEMALAFHKSCSHLGEQLVCFPSHVEDLCRVFNMVDGYEMSLDTMETAALTPANLQSWRSVGSSIRGASHGTNAVVETKRTPRKGKPAKPTSPKSRQSVNQSAATTVPTKGSTWSTLSKFGKPSKRQAKALFATSLNVTSTTKPTLSTATNVLAYIHTCYVAMSTNEFDSESKELGIDDAMPFFELKPENWQVQCLQKGGKEFYNASFVRNQLPDGKVVRRNKKQLMSLPSWIEGSKRPYKKKDIKRCMPQDAQCPNIVAANFTSGEPTVVFQTIEEALTMESVFILERLFRSSGGKSHWYDMPLSRMITLLRDHHVKNQVERGMLSLKM